MRVLFVQVEQLPVDFESSHLEKRIGFLPWHSSQYQVMQRSHS